MPAFEWYYAKNNQQRGPISALDLKQLADRGEVGPDDLVWREGMTEWTPASRVRGLFDPPAAPATLSTTMSAAAPSSGESVVIQPAAARMAEYQQQGSVLQPASAVQQANTAQQVMAVASERSPAAAAGLRVARPRRRHLFDPILDWTREQFDGQFLQSASWLFSAAGRWGLLAAVVATIASTVIGARKSGLETEAIARGVAVVATMLVMHYAAGRFLALRQRYRPQQGVLGSTAPSDCLALASVLAGLAMLAWLTLAALSTKDYGLLLAAIGAFIVAEYAAAVALNPEALGLRIDADAPAGEEALGILAFVAALLRAIGPVVFGAGAVLGTVALGYASVRLSMADSLTARATLAEVDRATRAILSAAAYPVAAYFVFLVARLAIRLAQAVLRTGSAEADRPA